METAAAQSSPATCLNVMLMISEKRSRPMARLCGRATAGRTACRAVLFWHHQHGMAPVPEQSGRLSLPLACLRFAATNSKNAHPAVTLANPLIQRVEPPDPPDFAKSRAAIA